MQPPEGGGPPKRPPASPTLPQKICQRWTGPDSTPDRSDWCWWGAKLSVFHAFFPWKLPRPSQRLGFTPFYRWLNRTPLVPGLADRSSRTEAKTQVGQTLGPLFGTYRKCKHRQKETEVCNPSPSTHHLASQLIHGQPCWISTCHFLLCAANPRYHIISSAYVFLWDSKKKKKKPT